MDVMFAENHSGYTDWRQVGRTHGPRLRRPWNRSDAADMQAQERQARDAIGMNAAGRRGPPEVNLQRTIESILVGSSFQRIDSRVSRMLLSFKTRHNSEAVNLPMP
ncbi:hypothetical protein COOONC_03044 [Cooperia oncophora]